MRPSLAMGASARDRVTIDLRGIGDAVRASAAARGMTVAHFSRQALIDVNDLRAAVPAVPSARDWASSKCKLTLRLYPGDFEILVVNAAQLGLSYGDYVGRLVRGTPLPMPLAQRRADRAALRESTDQLAELALSVRDLVRLFGQGSVAEARKYRTLLDTMGADVTRHIERASAFIASQ